MRCLAAAAIFFTLCAACGCADTASDLRTPEASTMRELIVLAAPTSGDPYYADVADAIFDFHVAFAREVDGRDDLIILSDQVQPGKQSQCPA